MKSAPTFEELKNNTIESRQRMIGKSGERFLKKSASIFVTKHESLICKLRRNSLFSLYFSKQAPNIISINDLNSDYDDFRPPMKMPNGKVDISSSQFFTSTILSFNSNPELVVSLFLDHLNLETESEKQVDICVYSYLLFPSSLAYFTYPQHAQLAANLINCFINQSHYDIASHLICSFFQNTSNFINTLFTLYEEKCFSENKPRASMIFFNYFIESLETASQLLSSFHDEFANKALKIGPNFFNQTFIDKLFLSQYKLINPHGILIRVFEFISSTKPIAPCQLIVKTLTKTRNRSPNLLTQFGGMTGLDVKSFAIFTSGYEMHLLMKLYCSSPQCTHAHLIQKSLQNIPPNSFRSIRIDCYPTFLDSKPILKSWLFPHFKRAIFKRVNENYRRAFSSICKFAAESGIDPIMFFIPEMVDSNNQLLIKKAVSRMQWGDMNKFLSFSFMMLSNGYADSVSFLDPAFAFNLSLDELDAMNYSADSIFENRIDVYKNEELLASKDFVLTRNLSSIPPNFCDQFDAKINYFRKVFNDLCESESKLLDLSISDLSIFRRIKLIINNILQVDSYFYKIRKIGVLLNEIFEWAEEFVKNDPELNVDNCIFVILFILVDNWELFIHVFMVYILEFKKNLCKGYIASILKKPWERLALCFQNSVYDLSPSIQVTFEHMLNGANGSTFI